MIKKFKLSEISDFSKFTKFIVFPKPKCARYENWQSEMLNFWPGVLRHN